LAPVLPADGAPDGEVNPLNYHFAYFVANFIMVSFNDKRLGRKIAHEISQEFNREHLSLLEISTVSDGMVFSNAATWYLVEKYCIDCKDK